jgi:hypothetical protein
MEGTPSQSASSALIIHNGGYASLLASLMLESEANAAESSVGRRSLIYAWIPPTGCGLFADEPPYTRGAVSALTRTEMVGRQAGLFGFREVFTEAQPTSRDRPSVGSLLLRAMELAADHRCERVIWPICVGSDLDHLHRVTERAALITELAALDFPLAPGSGGDCIRLSIPLADFTHAMLDDLGDDLDAPIEACWRSVGDLPASESRAEPEYRAEARS